MATRRTTKRTERTRTPEPTLRVDATNEVELDEDMRNRRGLYGDEIDPGYEPGDDVPEDELPMLVDDMPPGEVDEEDEDAHAPDDALGLYLRQMGAIPLSAATRN
jgi:hypothetical protein